MAKFRWEDSLTERKTNSEGFGLSSTGVTVFRGTDGSTAAWQGSRGKSKPTGEGYALLCGI
jgi:hypothetical protein